MWIAVGVTFAVVINLVIVAVWLTSDQVYWTVTKVETIIQTEVPKDASRSQVEAWFDRRGFEHSYFEGIVDDHNRRSIADEVGLTNAEVSGTIRGRIPDAARGLFYVKEIRIYFFFDQRGRLCKHWLDTFDYCP
jgi:hypothetical protein